MTDGNSPAEVWARCLTGAHAENDRLRGLLDVCLKLNDAIVRVSSGGVPVSLHGESAEKDETMTVGENPFRDGAELAALAPEMAKAVFAYNAWASGSTTAAAEDALDDLMMEIYSKIRAIGADDD